MRKQPEQALRLLVILPAAVAALGVSGALGAAVVARGGDSGDAVAAAAQAGVTEVPTPTPTPLRGCRISSASGGVGDELTVTLECLGIPEPGLGAWTVDVGYSPSALEEFNCTTTVPGIPLQSCGVEAPGTVRFQHDHATAGSASRSVAGVTGQVAIGTVSFRCLAAASSDLIVTVQRLEDVTQRPIGNGAEDGAIQCAAPVATSTPTFPLTSIALSKEDADTGERLAGWEIVVYRGSDCQGHPVNDAMTTTGLVMLQLPAGQYSFKETQQTGWANVTPLCQSADLTLGNAALVFRNQMVTTPTATPEPSDGDANGDGVTNSVDATLVLQFTAGLLPDLPHAQRADVNQDGHVDSLDALLILQFEAGLLDHLPV